MAATDRRFPAEWEKQQGVLSAFAQNGKDWPGKYEAMQWAFVEFIKKVAQVGRVLLVVADEKHQEKVKAKLEDAHVEMGQVSFISQKTNRSWMRDSGPIIVKNANGEREALNFNFNGWAKYSNYQLDRKVPAKVAEFLDIPLTQVLYKGKPVIMEGGALETNGKGTLIT